MHASALPVWKNLLPVLLMKRTNAEKIIMYIAKFNYCLPNGDVLDYILNLVNNIQKPHILTMTSGKLRKIPNLYSEV